VTVGRCGSTREASEIEELVSSLFLLGDVLFRDNRRAKGRIEGWGLSKRSLAHLRTAIARGSLRVRVSLGIRGCTSVSPVSFESCDSRLNAYTPLFARWPPFVQVIQHTHVRQKSLFHESGGLCKSEEPRTTGSTLSGYGMGSQGLWFSPLLYRAAYCVSRTSSISSFCELASAMLALFMRTVTLER
jgi:hypothetical protein